MKKILTFISGGTAMTLGAAVAISTTVLGIKGLESLLDPVVTRFILTFIIVLIIFICGGTFALGKIKED